MISIATETLIPLREAPARLPKRPNGKKLHISALYRWISSGVSGVVLEAVRIGGTTYTSLEALQRFAERLTGSEPAASPNQNKSEARALAASDRLAQMLGLGARKPGR